MIPNCELAYKIQYTKYKRHAYRAEEERGQMEKVGIIYTHTEAYIFTYTHTS